MLVDRGHAGAAGGRDAERLERGGNGVRGELAAARAGAGARDGLELVQLLIGHLPDRVPSHRLVDIADRDVLPLEAAGHDRAAVDHQAGEIEARERHDHAGDRLVTSGDTDERVEEVPAGPALDGIWLDLARD